MSWKRQILSYDAEALAELTSVGLVHRARKQVDAGNVALESDTPSEGILFVGSRTVAIGTGPLTEARCDCSASGSCVHVMAAVLFMRDQRAVAAATEAETAPALSAEEDLQQYPPAQIFIFAGKTGIRQAARLLSAVPEEERTIESGGTSIKIELGAGQQCRYVAGAGLGGIICEAPERQRKGIVTACLLHWWQARGQNIEWPEIDLDQTSDRPLTRNEIELTRRLDEALIQMLDTGLMHLPRHIEDVLRGLAWSARGENLPRLSAQVLRLSGELAAFRQQRAGADPLLLLNRITALKALLVALAECPPKKRTALRGLFKREYSHRKLGPLWLCSGYQYATRSDALGISVLLWDLNSGEALQVNVGRTGEAARTFHPHTAWQSVLAWQKGRSPAALNGQVLELKGAKVSSDGRLSQSKTTRIMKNETAGKYADRLETMGYRDWRQLTDAMTRRLGLAGETNWPVIIRPKHLQTFTVAEYEQQWVGWVGDRCGRWLRLSLPVNACHDQRVKFLNQLIKWTAGRIWGLVLDIRRTETQLNLTPVSVIIRKSNEWICLQPDLERIDLKRHARLGAWLRQRMRREKDLPLETIHPPDLSGLHDLFERIQEKLLGAAELGLRCSYLEEAPLKPLIADLQSIGVNDLAHCMERLEKKATADSLIRAQYALQAARQQYLIQGSLHSS